MQDKEVLVAGIYNNEGVMVKYKLKKFLDYEDNYLYLLVPLVDMKPYYIKIDISEIQEVNGKYYYHLSDIENG